MGSSADSSTRRLSLATGRLLLGAAGSEEEEEDEEDNLNLTRRRFDCARMAAPQEMNSPNSNITSRQRNSISSSSSSSISGAPLPPAPSWSDLESSRPAGSGPTARLVPPLDNLGAMLFYKLPLALPAPLPQTSIRQHQGGSLKWCQADHVDAPRTTTSHFKTLPAPASWNGHAHPPTEGSGTSRLGRRKQKQSAGNQFTLSSYETMSLVGWPNVNNSDNIGLASCNSNCLRYLDEKQSGQSCSKASAWRKRVPYTRTINTTMTSQTRRRRRRDCDTKMMNGSGERYELLDNKTTQGRPEAYWPRNSSRRVEPPTTTRVGAPIGSLLAGGLQLGKSFMMMLAKPQQLSSNCIQAFRPAALALLLFVLFTDSLLVVAEASSGPSPLGVDESSEFRRLAPLPLLPVLPEPEQTRQRAYTNYGPAAASFFQSIGRPAEQDGSSSGWPPTRRPLKQTAGESLGSDLSGKKHRPPEPHPEEAANNSKRRRKACYRQPRSGGARNSSVISRPQDKHASSASRSSNLWPLPPEIPAAGLRAPSTASNYPNNIVTTGQICSVIADNQPPTTISVSQPKYCHVELGGLNAAEPEIICCWGRGPEAGGTTGKPQASNENQLYVSSPKLRPHETRKRLNNRNSNNHNNHKRHRQLQPPATSNLSSWFREVDSVVCGRRRYAQGSELKLEKKLNSARSRSRSSSSSSSNSKGDTGSANSRAISADEQHSTSDIFSVIKGSTTVSYPAPPDSQSTGSESIRGSNFEEHDGPGRAVSQLLLILSATEEEEEEEKEEEEEPQQVLARAHRTPLEAPTSQITSAQRAGPARDMIAAGGRLKAETSNRLSSIRADYHRQLERARQSEPQAAAAAYRHNLPPSPPQSDTFGRRSHLELEVTSESGREISLDSLESLEVEAERETETETTTTTTTTVVITKTNQEQFWQIGENKQKNSSDLLIETLGPLRRSYQILELRLVEIFYLMSNYLQTTAATATTSANFYFLTRSLPIAIILGLIILVTFVGNVLVCLSVIKVRKLRNPPNYLLISLAISDLCVACLVMPFGLYVSINDKWQLGRLLCNVYVVSDVTSCTASILNLCVISIDRYLAITRPLRYCVKRTTRLMLILIGIVWVCACLISVPPLLISGNEYGTQEEPRCEVSQSLWYQLYATCISFYIPLIVMIFLYYNIYTAAKRVVEAEMRARAGIQVNSNLKQANNLSIPIDVHPPAANQTTTIRPNNNNNNNNNNSSNSIIPNAANKKQPAAVQPPSRPHSATGSAEEARGAYNPSRTSSVMRERKASITLGVIMSAFTICWLPFFIIALLRPFSESVNNIPRTVVLLTLWLGYANSLLNPIIYVTFHHDFRNAFKHLLTDNKVKWSLT